MAKPRNLLQDSSSFGEPGAQWRSDASHDVQFVVGAYLQHRAVQLLRSRGVAAADVARRLSTPERSVQRIFSGDVRLSVGEFATWAAALEEDLVDLLPTTLRDGLPPEYVPLLRWSPRSQAPVTFSPPVGHATEIAWQSVVDELQVKLTNWQRAGMGHLLTPNVSAFQLADALVLNGVPGHAITHRAIDRPAAIETAPIVWVDVQSTTAVVIALAAEGDPSREAALRQELAVVDAMFRATGLEADRPMAIAVLDRRTRSRLANRVPELRDPLAADFTVAWQTYAQLLQDATGTSAEGSFDIEASVAAVTTPHNAEALTVVAMAVKKAP